MAESRARKVEREARLHWIPIAKMRINPHAQRELNEARVNKILANLDLEQVGNPTVNHRDGHYWIVDGQHRVEALRRFGFENDQYQCWMYEGLTEEEESEKFLKLNDVLVVDLMAKFKVGVQAGREEDCDINRIVMAQGLLISRERVDGAIRAVGTVQKVYRRADGQTLGRSLRIIRDSFGDAGLEAPVIDGVGRLCARYNGQLDDDGLVKNLRTLSGGVNGLLQKAEQTRRATGTQRGDAVAATLVDVANRGKRGKGRLPDWWAAS